MIRTSILAFLIWEITLCSGLSCFQCDIVYNVSDCQNVQPCSGANDICYTDVNVPNTPFQTFSLGCRSKSLCTVASPVAIIGRRREAPLYGCNQCCDTSGCNANLCRKGQIQWGIQREFGGFKRTPSEAYSYYCHGKTHLKFGDSRKTNVRVYVDEFFLFTDTNEEGVFIMSINSQVYHKIPVSASNPIAIDYDPVDGKMYWTDVTTEMIRSSSLDGSDETDLYKLPSGATPDGIAVDPVSRLLFYTDTGNDVIGLMKLDGTDKATVIRSGLKEPRAIVLDSNKGTIYWTDWGLPAIEKASYDGNDRQKIVTSGLKWPNGLAIDITAQKLYWADGGLDKIVSVNIDGSDRRTLYTGSSSSHLFGIAVMGDFIFYTDWSRKSVMTIDTTGGASQFGPQQFGRLNGIQVFKSGNHKTGLNGCSVNQGGCSRICIPDQNNGTKCLCPDGTYLQQDRKSCA